MHNSRQQHLSIAAHIVELVFIALLSPRQYLLHRDHLPNSLLAKRRLT
jgi:hypothetical protein